MSLLLPGQVGGLVVVHLNGAIFESGCWGKWPLFIRGTVLMYVRNAWCRAYRQRQFTGGRALPLVGGHGYKHLMKPVGRMFHMTYAKYGALCWSVANRNTKLEGSRVLNLG